MRPVEIVLRVGRRLTGGQEVHAVLPALPEGHVSVVTGASSGIGVETALGLARAGSAVWMVGRNAERLQASVERVRQVPGAEAVTGLRADFANLDDVRRLSARIREETDGIDVLVNNAGVWNLGHQLSEQGVEGSLAVNHLATFALTTALLDRVEARSGRVVTVSSRLHREAKGLGLDDPAWERRPYRGLEAYAESKLANVLFANALARRVTRATSTSVHPGDVATNVVRDSRLLMWGMALVRPALLTPEEGAQCSLHAAASAEASGRSGVYFARCREVAPSELALDEALQERLWAWSEDQTR